MSLENCMDNGGNILKVHIIKKRNGSNYIGGDSTRLVHLKLTNSNFGDLEENCSYSLIKPEKHDDKTIILNPKYKPSKTSKVHTSKNRNDAEEYEAEIEFREDETDGETFETINKKPGKTKLKKMTVKCISISRIIQTTYGEYRIAKIRDTENNKADINLNKHSKNKMEVDKVYHIENFKVTDFKNEDSKYRRLATLPNTLIKQIERMEEGQFSHITLGDEKANGTCIGIGKVFGYYGCKNCWKKVEDDASFCLRCNESTVSKTIEFSAELYVEIEEEIMTAQGFKRQFSGLKIETVEDEEITDILETRVVGKNLGIEYNEGDKDDNIILVKIQKIDD